MKPSPYIYDVEDAHKRARRRIPHMLYSFVDGAAGTESANRMNLEALERVRLQPRVLEDVSERSLKTTFLGEEMGLRHDGDRDDQRSRPDRRAQRLDHVVSHYREQRGQHPDADQDHLQRECPHVDRAEWQVQHRRGAEQARIADWRTPRGEGCT